MSPSIRPFLLCLTSLGLSLGASAQETSGVPGSSRQGPGGQTVTIDFPGGTLEEYVAAIRKAGKNVNILLSNLGSKIILPPMRLHDVGVDSALQAAGQIIANDYMINVRQHWNGVGEPVFAVAAQEVYNAISPVSGLAARSRTVRVFSLNLLTEPQQGLDEVPGAYIKVDTLLTAIDTGLSVVTPAEGRPQDAAAKVRYHRDSGLLFVEGTQEQIGIVEQVLSNLTADVRRAQSEAMMRKAASPNVKIDAKKSDQ